MSTQPIGRRHHFAATRRVDARRVLLSLLTVAAAFGVGYLGGHTKATPAALAEHEPPSLPAVATPVAPSLEAVPPLETGARQQPPVVHQAAPPVRGSTTAGGGTSVNAPAPTITTPVVTTPPPAAPAPAPAPVQHTAPAEHTAPAPKRPAPSSGGGKSGSGSSGTSFESSA